MTPWLVFAASAAVTLETETLEEGVEVVLFVTDDAGDARSGETVRVVHRPGLAGEQERAIGITDGRGRVRWTPETSGVARIRAGEQVQAVRVIPARPRTTSAVILALLVAAGLGAFGWGVRGPRRAARRT